MTLLLAFILAVLPPDFGSTPVDSVNLEVENFMKKWKLRGMQIAAIKDGEIVLERAYGWADVNCGRHMSPDNTMRIASASKLITAAGIMKLKDEGLLNLDDKVFGEDGILSDYNKYIRDRRYRDITVENLLRHEAGFSQKGGDPMFSGRRGADNEELLRRELARPLAFAPGTSMEYSNLGFLLLSMVIEKLGGKDYEAWIQENLLEPAGITDMRIAHNSAGERYPEEVHYYTDNGDEERCYGRNDIRALSGAGAWTASATDLCIFASAIDGRKGVRDVISPESVFEMTCWYDPYTYSLGWNDTDPGKGWTRTGSYSGTSALIWYFPEGDCWALITNTSSWKGSRFSRNTKHLMSCIRQKFINLQNNHNSIQ